MRHIFGALRSRAILQSLKRWDTFPTVPVIKKWTYYHILVEEKLIKILHALKIVRSAKIVFLRTRRSFNFRKIRLIRRSIRLTSGTLPLRCQTATAYRSRRRASGVRYFRFRLLEMGLPKMVAVWYVSGKVPLVSPIERCISQIFRKLKLRRVLEKKIFALRPIFNASRIFINFSATRTW